jgi:type VI secretion system Hcp family effector
MAIDSLMVFLGYPGTSKKDYLPSESQVDLTKNLNDNTELIQPFKDAGPGNIFEVEDYSFDIEQTLSIGSQSTGAGAGKVSFNPFSITRKIDMSSPVFYENACSGKPFRNVYLGLRKSAGTEATGIFFLLFTFKLVAVKTVGWAHDDEAPKETVTFEYGGLQIRYGRQAADGSIAALIPGGWNRVKNIQDRGPDPIQ